MTYDAIIIGGGHNGLVAAAYLAKAGRKVLVLEQRAVLGGAAATEEVLPGFRFNTGAHDAGLFRQEIIDELALEKHGLSFISSPVAAFTPRLQADAPPLILWNDLKKTAETLSAISEKDAESFPRYIEHIRTMTAMLDEIILRTPPNLFENRFADLTPWLKSGLKFKRMGKQDMMAFLRVLPMSAWQFLDEWFESERLKGLLGSTSIFGSLQGPMAAGTAFMLFYQHLGAQNSGLASSRQIKGGIGQLSDALAAVVRAQGGEIHTETPVQKIVFENGVATGVQLQDGEIISSKIVISNADPKRTFFELVGARHLGPEFNRKVRAIKMKGSTAKLNLALSALPEFVNAPSGQEHLQGHIVICPSLEYLERAYDDAKYGRFSEQPLLDITIPSLLDPSLAPEGKHVMSITMRYAPFVSKKADCEHYGNHVRNKIIDTLADYAPNLRDCIEHSQVLTAIDWQQEYGMTEGSILHGQMGLDQLLFMRPIPGFGQYHTPIENLYLCGAGTHPGGGVTGAPGRNAAKEILKKR